MLILFLKIGGKRYAIDARRVIEVVPFVPLERPTRHEKSCLGNLEFHKNNIPIFDVNIFVSGKASQKNLTTRIVILNQKVDYSGIKVGLIAEEINETLRVDEEKLSHLALSKMLSSEKNSNDGEIKNRFQIISVDELIDAICADVA